ncbi:MAG TPA: VOC family protein [Thermomicrobiales bacterium]|nr:VOC family protein [Thermomicrobiales bacterium]
MTATPRFGFALEYVSDVEAVKRFYVDVLGLAVEREHPTFVQFKDRAGANFAIASDESLGGRGELELYWLVDDAEVAFRELSGKAEVVVPLREMPFGKVFGINDPAGQPRYLLEFARERPSRPVQ